MFLPDINQKLNDEFYQRAPETVAKELIGKVIVKKHEDIYISGMIVETEAYLDKNDLSSHSYIGKTKRNEPMFSKGGCIYVYKIYGVHWCFNVVTENEGVGSAVLIRAVEPLTGIETMKSIRKTSEIKSLCSGPGKFSQAFSFSNIDNFQRLDSNRIFIQAYNNYCNDDILNTTRVGITKSINLNLRFYLKNCIYVSRK